jgi:hypothetical protein
LVKTIKGIHYNHVSSILGNVYTSYGKVPIGSIMAVIGVSPDKEFWVVQVPSDIAPDERGWVPARYCHAQNTSNVPIIQPPPPP